MSKATSLDELNSLHQLVAKSLNTRLTDDLKDGIPTDAATLGAAIKFLKDNEITADPASKEDLTELRDKLKQQAASRKKTAGNVIALANSDLDLDYKEA